MLVIHHRRNTINSLKAVNSHLGVEVDIRSFGNKLIINHDPFKAVSYTHLTLPTISDV